MINFTAIQDRELFEEPFLSEYRDQINFFYSELVRLNTQLFIMDKIRRFRFDLFARPDQTTFFRTVLNSFFESSILIVSRLVTDQDGEFKTITRFKNKIVLNIKEDYKTDFIEQLKLSKFDKNMKQLLERVKNRRNQRIAHSIDNLDEEELRKSTLYLVNLFQLRDQLNLILSQVSFDTTRMMLPLNYEPSIMLP